MPTSTLPPKPAWPTNPAKSVASLRGHGDTIDTLAFTSDRGILASSSRDGKSRVWDVGSALRERGVVETGGDRFQSLAFAATGRTMAAGSGALNGFVRLIDVSDKAPREFALLRGARGVVAAVAFSPDGRLVAGGGEDRTVRVWDAVQGSRGDLRAQLPGHAKSIRALAFGPDGQALVSASQDGTVRLWSVSRIRSSERAVLPQGTEVNAVAWSADGKTVATAGQDGVIRLWDPTAMKPTPRAELSGHLAPVHFLLITPDSRTLVSVGDGPRVMNWDLASGKAFCEWDVPKAPFCGAAATPDGRYLALGARDGTINLYRIAEKRA